MPHMHNLVLWYLSKLQQKLDSNAATDQPDFPNGFVRTGWDKLAGVVHRWESSQAWACIKRQHKWLATLNNSLSCFLLIRRTVSFFYASLLLLISDQNIISLHRTRTSDLEEVECEISLACIDNDRRLAGLQVGRRVTEGRAFFQVREFFFEGCFVKRIYQMDRNRRSDRFFPTFPGP